MRNESARKLSSHLRGKRENFEKWVRKKIIEKQQPHTDIVHMTERDLISSHYLLVSTWMPTICVYTHCIFSSIDFFPKFSLSHNFCNIFSLRVRNSFYIFFLISSLLQQVATSENFICEQKNRILRRGRNTRERKKKLLCEELNKHFFRIACLVNNFVLRFFTSPVQKFISSSSRQFFLLLCVPLFFSSYEALSQVAHIFRFCSTLLILSVLCFFFREWKEVRKSTFDVMWKYVMLKQMSLKRRRHSIKKRVSNSIIWDTFAALLPRLFRFFTFLIPLLFFLLKFKQTWKWVHNFGISLWKKQWI